MTIINLNVYFIEISIFVLENYKSADFPIIGHYFYTDREGYVKVYYSLDQKMKSIF